MSANEMTSSGFDSSRAFCIWFFTKSHGQLLLLSEKGNTERTRIELLFADVAVINVPTIMNGLTVSLADPGATEREFARIPHQFDRNKKLFLMSGAGWSGYVIAGSAWFSEADRSFDAPSDLIEPIWSSPFGT